MIDLYNKGLDYLIPLQPDLPDWMKRIKEDGIGRKVPIVRDDMGQFLRMMCSIKSPKNILEIGCGISYATHWMLLGCNNSKITALDHNQDRLNQCSHYLEMSGYLDQVELKCCWAEDFFKTNTQKYDLIFQDSTKKGYAGMIDQCHQCLNEDGILIADNIFFNGKILGLTSNQEKKYAKGVAALQEFNQQIARHPGFCCNFFSLSDGVLVAQRIS